MDTKKDFSMIAEWLKLEVAKSSTKGLVIGLSGGIDSSVAAGLAVAAVSSKNVLGVIIPCESNGQATRKHDTIDAIRVAEHYNINYIIHPIGITADSFKPVALHNTFEVTDKAFGNIKARLRMTVLRMYAELNNYLVLGTTNKSEDIVGYFTKGGDGGHGVDVEPTAGYYKSEIRKFGAFLNLPPDLVNRIPSAGLWDNQTDEDELGFKYETLEMYWRWKENHYPNKGQCPVNPRIAEKIESMYRATEHKRILPPTFDRNSVR